MLTANHPFYRQLYFLFAQWVAGRTPPGLKMKKSSVPSSVISIGLCLVAVLFVHG